MDANFDVRQISVDRLLKDWRWLCNDPVSLVAKSAFGDLFLRNEAGNVLRLDVSVGQLTKIAHSVEQFLLLAGTEEKKQEWFAIDDERRAAQKGLIPGEDECIAFKIPVVFRESATAPNNAYVGNLYECVSFLGSVHRQIAGLGDGSEIRLQIKEEPPTR